MNWFSDITLPLIACLLCLHCYNVVYLHVYSEEYPPIREEDALTKWAADPANTAWMESKE